MNRNEQTSKVVKRFIQSGEGGKMQALLSKKVVQVHHLGTLAKEETTQKEGDKAEVQIESSLRTSRKLPILMSVRVRTRPQLMKALHLLNR
mmetsp:Transcript_17755/g.32863  ORF Transcript_17755/g.32863 Transcript_17755/m.32863 type:complete len:91 (-) Transcript_17755:248-520(-)